MFQYNINTIPLLLISFGIVGLAFGPLFIIFDKSPAVAEIIKFVVRVIQGKQYSVTLSNAQKMNGILVVTLSGLSLILLGLIMNHNEPPVLSPTAASVLSTATYTPTPLILGGTETRVHTETFTPTLPPPSCKDEEIEKGYFYFDMYSKKPQLLSCQVLKSLGIALSGNTYKINTVSNESGRYFIGQEINRPRDYRFERRFNVTPIDFSFSSCNSEICDIDFFLGIGNEYPFVEGKVDNIAVHYRLVKNNDSVMICLLSSIYEECNETFGEQTVILGLTEGIHFKVDGKSISSERLIDNKPIVERTMKLNSAPTFFQDDASQDR